MQYIYPSCYMLKVLLSLILLQHEQILDMPGPAVEEKQISAGSKNNLHLARFDLNLHISVVD